MKSSTEYQIEQGLAFLFVGEPKTGKTNVAMAFPDPYVLDVDGNLSSAVRMMAGKKFWYDTPVREVKEMHEIYKKSLACLSIACKTPEVKTIVVDTISLLADYICAWCIQEHVRMGDKDKSGNPINAMTIPNYGKLLSILRQLIFELRASGKYVVVTSHQQVIQDELSKGNRYALALPGQAKDTLGSSFTDVWAMTATPGAMDKVKYEIRTAPTGFHVALGSSIRTIPNRIDITGDNPSQVWAKLQPLIEAKRAA